MTIFMYPNNKESQPMDPQETFCHNPECPASGKMGRGNIGVYSRKQQRYICHECKTTFTQSKGMYCHLRYSCEVVTQVITLLAYGCPLQAIGRIFFARHDNLSYRFSSFSRFSLLCPSIPRISLAINICCSSSGKGIGISRIRSMVIDEIVA